MKIIDHTNINVQQSVFKNESRHVFKIHVTERNLFGLGFQSSLFSIQVYYGDFRILPKAFHLEYWVTGQGFESQVVQDQL